MAGDAGRTIGQVSELLGVPVPTLRSWHLRYGIGVPERTAGGHRRYRDADIAALASLSTAIARGIAPRTAARALREPQPRTQEPLPLLVELLSHASTGDQDGLAAVLDRGADELGLDEAVDRLLLPALHEVGHRWALGRCDVAVEHLSTAAARTWLTTQLDRPGAVSGGPPVLLAGAPGNQHTVALEAFELLLRRRGCQTRQLGASTPVPSLLVAVETTGARAVVITAHQSSRRRAAEEALRAVAARGDCDLYFAGAAFDRPGHRRGLPGCYLGTVLLEAADLVAGRAGALAEDNGAGRRFA